MKFGVVIAGTTCTRSPKSGTNGRRSMKFGVVIAGAREGSRRTRCRWRRSMKFGVVIAGGGRSAMHGSVLPNAAIHEVRSGDCRRREPAFKSRTENAAIHEVRSGDCRHSLSRCAPAFSERRSMKFGVVIAGTSTSCRTAPASGAAIHEVRSGDCRTEFVRAPGFVGTAAIHEVRSGDCRIPRPEFMKLDSFSGDP